MNRNCLLGLFAATAVLMTACSCTCGVDGNVTPGSAEDFAANVPNTVYFDFDKSNLTDSAKKRVEAQAAWLKTYTGSNVTVEGHTDIRGTAEYNMALGEARANSTAKELRNLGVAGERITTVSYGKERVVDTGTTEMSHAKNRRSVTVVG
ncbi:MAG: OmpA family protein [Alphaproteobacteria bacterium]|nr:OmpA family protein [Alphaproteobacteria bacterium]